MEDVFEKLLSSLKRYSTWAKFFTVIEFMFIPPILWWLFYDHLPAPGWAVALIAGAAAAMSVHDDLRGWQKGCWMLIIGALLVTELRAINKDRTESQNQTMLDRKAQDAEFASVRGIQNHNFSATASGLKTAISGIESTLLAADTTLTQTRPHATVKFDRIEFPVHPSKIESNQLYDINYFYVNSGLEAATNLKVLAELFIAKADDAKSQAKLVERFENDWKSGSYTTLSTSVLIPNTPVFGTFERKFTDDEIRELTPSGTIYYLLRFEYSDDTGRWRSDKCGSFQRGSPTQIDMNISHPCSIFEKFRYAVKRR